MNPNFILARREAQLQGVNTVKVWAGPSGLYDSTFLTQAGSYAEGASTMLQNLPFYTEYQSNPALAALVNQLGSVDDVNNNSIGPYEEALLVQEIVTKAAAAGGTLNRAALFTALSNEHSFNAQGIIGATDIAARVPSPCIVMVEVVNGKWTRQYPTCTRHVRLQPRQRPKRQVGPLPVGPANAGRSILAVPAPHHAEPVCKYEPGICTPARFVFAAQLDRCCVSRTPI